jgi:thioester reductase-like protein
LSTSATICRLGGENGRPHAPVDVGVVPGLGWIATDQVVGDRDCLEEPRSDILFLQYTSGSTSLPRGIAVTHANVIHNAGLTVDHANPVYVSWLPHFHDLGLVGCLLSCVVGGGSAHLFSPLDFMRRPHSWLRLISDRRATITAAPNAAYEYCAREDKVGEAELDGIDLTSLRTMANCAEPIRPDTFERFFRRVARCGLRRSAYVGGYGLAEHTLCVTSGGRRQIRPTDFDRGDRIDASLPPVLSSCGRSAPDVTLRIVDPHTRRLVADGEIGEIWADSPSKAAGYWRLPELSEERFHARIAGHNDGHSYLRTGDLGFLDGGELFVCGRLSDMILCKGRNIFPNDIEALVERSLPVLTGHVVAFGIPDPKSATERLVLLVEAREGIVDLRQLGHIIQHGSEVAVGAVARVPRGTITRTSSGKIARQHCREKWQSGEIRQLEAFDFTDEYAAETIEVLIDDLAARAKALGNPDATLEELGLDSITLVNLSLRLEGLVEAHGLGSPEMMERVADLSLLQALRISDLRNGFLMLRTTTSNAEEIPRLLDSAATAARRRQEVQMRGDTALALSEPASQVDGGEILITGATGFLGAFVMRSLVELTNASIVALVRARDAAHGIARLRQALLDTDMTPEAVSAAVATRLRAVPGDVTQPRCALSDAAWSALAESVGSIYHFAAEVDYVKSYGLLRGANVLGTREIIRLSLERRRKSLHYASTTFVHGWSTKRVVYESDVHQPLEDLDFGYSQSKWVAEQLVVRARQIGLPITIYRPSLVTASESARFVEHDIVTRVVGYMIRHGLTVDTVNQISFLPVDTCARNIVAISLSPTAPAPILHLTVDDYYRMADVSAAVSDIFGYRFDCVSLETFVQHAHAHCTESDPLYPLLSFLDRNTSRILRMGDKRYDSRNYRRARAEAPLAVTHPDLHATVEPIVRYLLDEGLVPAARGATRAVTRSVEAAE